MHVTNKSLTLASKHQNWIKSFSMSLKHDDHLPWAFLGRTALNDRRRWPVGVSVLEEHAGDGLGHDLRHVDAVSVHVLARLCACDGDLRLAAGSEQVERPSCMWIMLLIPLKWSRWNASLLPSSPPVIVRKIFSRRYEYMKKKMDTATVFGPLPRCKSCIALRTWVAAHGPNPSQLITVSVFS